MLCLICTVEILSDVSTATTATLASANSLARQTGLLTQVIDELPKEPT